MNSIVLVAALGYFVDVYDLILFSVVRRASLSSIGVADGDLMRVGVSLINAQMLGMLLGGVLWGVLGDKRGRVSVLLGSILTYSLANLANGFVTTVEQYYWLRFIAGIGLAGELGAGITLVSEVMSAERRGWGTTIVATLGVAGAVAAALVGESFSWRTAYFIGGALGLSLLVLRFAVYESGMFESARERSDSMGSLSLIFKNRDRFLRYLCCILVGLPTWYGMGILMTFSPEIGLEMGMSERPEAGRAIMFAYIGIVFGDLSSGILSQMLRSRRKAAAIFLGLTAVSVFYFLSRRNISPTDLYWAAIPVGFSLGYWAICVTMAAEQFGTNLRATAATTVPNLIRGAVVPLTLGFGALTPGYGLIGAASIVGAAVIIIALAALFKLEETFGKDLDYVES